MSFFLDIAPIVSLLKQELLDNTVQFIGGVDDLNAVNTACAVLYQRALFVVNHSSTPDALRGVMDGRFLTEKIAIIIHIRNRSNDDVYLDTLTMREIRDNVFELLDGYSFSPYWGPIQYIGGELLSLDEEQKHAVRWSEIYQTYRPFYSRMP